MDERKPLSKKIRFEIFKRDLFTCQYCGKKAPNVVLEIDHIKPVSNGGTNDVLNLVTSCFDCNRGKGKNELDDNSEIEKQRKQLELSQEKFNQINMMIEWKESISDSIAYTVDKLSDYFEKNTGFFFTDSYKKEFRLYVKKYELETIIDALDVVFSQYKNNIKSGISKIKGIITGIEEIKKYPYMDDINRLVNIAKYNVNNFYYKAVKTSILQLYHDGYDIIKIELFIRSKRFSNASSLYDDFIEKYGVDNA